MVNLKVLQIFFTKRFTKVKKTKKEDRNEFIKAMEEDITSLHKSQPYDLKELPN